MTSLHAIGVLMVLGAAIEKPAVPSKDNAFDDL
jgi:hypothetical protein